ncbi:hypothetical protein DFQ29_007348 [Apophysomyces sp. BC1021]|nr:hypothetical protein DFQ29_007348 [Apophysomyces sp. BC1021]
MSTDPNQHFTWMAPGIVNLLIRRLSQLQLEGFADLEIALQGFVMAETTPYFAHTPLTTDPLLSLPPEEALRLIDVFFTTQPYSVILNKTLLLQQYWSDTVDPLLLSVVCGTGLYMSQLGGRLPCFWGAMAAGCRNPILNHAHVLLQDASAEATLGKYQAVVLLSIFESLFGLPKRGMSLLALSYMLASQLGVLDNKFQGDPIEQEMVVWTFWSAYVMTIYGCVELGLNNRDALSRHKVPFPPMNIYVSASFGIVQHPNPDLVESFYTQVVIAQFSDRIFRHTPRPQHNLFGMAIPNAAITQSENAVEVQIGKITDEFATFVDTNRILWSPIQRYMIETTMLLYKVHFRFLKPALKLGQAQIFELPIRYLSYLDELDPAKPEIASRLNEVLPTVLMLMDVLKDFLSLLRDQPRSLPHGLMEANLETCARLLMLTYQLIPSVDLLQRLKDLVALSKEGLWCNWGATKIVRCRIQSFLRHHRKKRTKSGWLNSLAAEESSSQIIATVQAPDIFQQFLLLDDMWLQKQ